MGPTRNFSRFSSCCRKSRRPFAFSSSRASLGSAATGRRPYRRLVGKYNKVVDEGVRVTMERLVNTSMELGQDPNDYVMANSLARSKLEKMDKPFSHRKFKNVCVQRFTAEYMDIKFMMYRDRAFDSDQMQSTMRHLYLYHLSRIKRSKGATGGGGITMTTAISTWYNCGNKGHYSRAFQGKDSKISRSAGAHDKPKNNDSSMGKPVSKVGAEHRWCSVHKTNFHDDTER